jgi:hypothetical protein
MCYAMRITGTHFLLYSKDAEADRAFFRDVLQFRSVDAGEGWLIFALPPAELAVHPGEGDFAQSHAEIYLMCDDLRSMIRSLKAKKIKCTPVTQAGWGMKTTIRLPSGGKIGLYQPRHPTAI